MQITRLINILSIGFLIIISTTRLYAQNLTNNPISYFGIGETNRLFGSIEGGIGQSGLTFVDSTLINYQNPASYSFLAKGQPLFRLLYLDVFLFFLKTDILLLVMLLI